MATGGQTLNDRMLAARHSIAGQGLAKAVCKSSTEELIGPKRKHLDYLIRCTEEPNVSIPNLANLLLERTQNQNWIVVFKSLVTIHHLMCYGNERFTQYLASSNTNFQLSNFLDKGGVQGYDMSPYVRRYASYLAEKAVAYRTVAFDFCKVKRGKDGGTLRSMNAEKLLKTLPVLNQQLDSLLAFQATTQDLNNGVINGAFMLLFRDLIRLFACYNDGIINLLEKYFDMNKKNARDALDIYKMFLIRMDRVAEFLKVAEKVGIDRGELPSHPAKAPSSLLEALEAHLANLEGRKPGSNATTPTNAPGTFVNVASAVSVLSSTSSAFETGSGKIDESLQKQLLAEEEQAMAKYKDQRKVTNPFAAAEPPKSEAGTGGETPNILDLFGVQAPANPAPSTAPAPAATETSAKQSAAARASDDLLQLSGNPFANVLNAASTTATASTTSTNSSSNNFATPGFTDSANANAIGASFFDGILQPQSGNPGSAYSNTNGASANNPGGKIISGDLDASLANLTSNLDLAPQPKPTNNNHSVFHQPKGPAMAANRQPTFS